MVIRIPLISLLSALLFPILPAFQGIRWLMQACDEMGGFSAHIKGMAFTLSCILQVALILVPMIGLQPVFQMQLPTPQAQTISVDGGETTTQRVMVTRQARMDWLPGAYKDTTEYIRHYDQRNGVLWIKVDERKQVEEGTHEMLERLWENLRRETNSAAKVESILSTLEK